MSANYTPRCDRLLGHDYQLTSIDAAKRIPQLIVSVVPSLLKLDETIRNQCNFSLNHAGDQLRGCGIQVLHFAMCKLLTNVIHLAMSECASHLPSQAVGRPRCCMVRSLRNQEMI
jgi:hypothetical protein